MQHGFWVVSTNSWRIANDHFSLQHVLCDLQTEFLLLWNELCWDFPEAQILCQNYSLGQRRPTKTCVLSTDVRCTFYICGTRWFFPESLLNLADRSHLNFSMVQIFLQQRLPDLQLLQAWKKSSTRNRIAYIRASIFIRLRMQMMIGYFWTIHVRKFIVEIVIFNVAPIYEFLYHWYILFLPWGRYRTYMQVSSEE